MENPNLSAIQQVLGSNAPDVTIDGKESHRYAK